MRRKKIESLIRHLFIVWTDPTHVQTHGRTLLENWLDKKVPRKWIRNAIKLSCLTYALRHFSVFHWKWPSFVLNIFFPLLISSYVDARQYHLEDSRLYAVTTGGRGGSYDEESPCGDRCPCQKLQYRAKNDPYIFSLATNPFYLWLICTVIKS